MVIFIPHAGKIKDSAHCEYHYLLIVFIGLITILQALDTFITKHSHTDVPRLANAEWQLIDDVISILEVSLFLLSFCLVSLLNRTYLLNPSRYLMPFSKGSAQSLHPLFLMHYRHIVLSSRNGCDTKRPWPGSQERES